MKVFVKYKHVACKNFTLKVLSEVFFMIFQGTNFEKCYSYWAASDYHLRDGLRRPIRLQEMSTSPQNIY